MKLKYNNLKTVVDGIKFDSKRESMHYLNLKLLERGKVITDLKLQVPFDLAPSVIINKRKKPALRYFADFTYSENGKFVVNDVKGVLTDTYIIKRHLMKHLYDIDIYET